MRLPADRNGGRQFKPTEIDAEGGSLIARETGGGYEFWWIRCGCCLEIFGAVVHQKVLSAACAHCDSLQLISIEQREDIRARRRLEAAPN
jgi:hypothetical protein